MPRIQDYTEIGFRMPHATLRATYYPNAQSKRGAILVPGITEHRSSLEPLAKQIQQDMNVWTVDLNGQGESTGRFRPRHIIHSLADMTTQVRAWYELDSLGVAGNSIGGLAAGIVAAKQPESIDALCLLSTPPALQEVMPRARRLARKASPSALHKAARAFDAVPTAINARYREKSHPLFDADNPYAQFGALRVDDLDAILDSIERAPRLDTHAPDIRQPTLAVYGSDAKLFGIREPTPSRRTQKVLKKVLGGQWRPAKQALGIRSHPLPRSYRRMLRDMPGLMWTGIAPGADHSLNGRTRTDANWNEDQKYRYVSDAVRYHLDAYL